MAGAVERLVNLALYLASRREYVTAEVCRSAGLGYPEHQDIGAFLRMFERDKDALRAAGLVLDVRRVGEVEAYRLDAAATFTRPVALSPTELATVRAVAVALAGDPGFPFGEDLALALGKLGAGGSAGPIAVADLVAETPADQAAIARELAEAVQSRKRVTFDYTNAAGEHKHHDIEPYGVFFREGRWYLAGRDRALDDTRTYAMSRMQGVSVNAERPRTPDFERPAHFDVRDHERLPFQYGPVAIPSVLRFDPDTAWRAVRLARRRGTLAEQPDGSVLWSVDARDLDRLAEWLTDEGPGITALRPPELLEVLRAGLERVVASHD